ncbi:thioesterase domain-containing protein [Chryseobacterium sp. JJR-5R]|uniref:thioesterase II family protein n=1 Tax=Chryseobacterium sp. JJR-5R TaxID=3093923 RepID=UPI002A758557|nr:thioesterase domain-containing protein [Chryseobacterium sp. JJR-5R]WPO84499.1 thioesterase domain-containing protein [Chryseobacterium sp. JJR-5R]
MNTTTKILALPFAGGGKHSFYRFAEKVPNFHTLEYPGRGTRFNDPSIDDIELLLEDLLQVILPHINASHKYFLYGHSMGALLAYLISHKIERKGLKLPSKLIVSGKNSPCCARKREKISDLSSDLFWEKLKSYGGISDEIIANEDIRTYYEPIIKSDFKIVENFEYKQMKPLSIPIDVFYGDNEEVEDYEIIKWQDKTCKNVNIKKMKGNHFFIYKHEPYLVQYFNKLQTII